MITLDPNIINTIQFQTCDVFDGELLVIKATPELGPCTTTTKPVNAAAKCSSASVSFHPVDDLSLKEGTYKLEIFNSAENLLIYRSRVEVLAFCDEVVPVPPDFCETFIGSITPKQLACIQVDCTSGGNPSTDYSLVTFITSGGDVPQ